MAYVALDWCRPVALMIPELTTPRDGQYLNETVEQNDESHRKACENEARAIEKHAKSIETVTPILERSPENPMKDH